jgi:hypothetical protein
MERVRRGIAAVDQGWSVLWNNGKLMMLMVGGLLLIFGGLSGHVVLAARGATTIGDYVAAIVIAVALIAGVWAYAAAFAAVAQEMESGEMSIRRAFGATFGRLHAVIVWGVVTSLVHTLILGSGIATVGLGLQVSGRGLFTLVWDAAALLVLPALILDTERRGRILRSFAVSFRGFVESLVVTLVFALAGFVAAFMIAVAPFTIEWARLAAWILEIVAISWWVAARVAAYQLVVHAPEAALTTA